MLLRLVYISTLLLSFGFFIWFQYFNYIFYLSNTDDSIYAQALQLISWDNINPFIPVRQVHIFNDHFDLIIIPFALTLAKIFPPLAVGYGLEIFFIFLACCVLFYMYKKQDISFSVLTMATMILLMSESTFMAVTFPFQPSTWSIFPLTLLGYYIFKDNHRGVVLSYLFLLLFKESYILVGGVLGLYYLYQRKYKLSIILLLITFFWYILAFQLRYWFWDYPSIHYDKWGAGFNIEGIKQIFSSFFFGHKVLQHNIFAFLPVLILLVFAMTKKTKVNIESLLPLLLLFPLWGLNFSMGSENFWNNHRVAFYSPLLAMFVVFTFQKENILKKMIIPLMLFFIVINMEDFIRYIPVNQRGIREMPKWSERWERKKAIDDVVKKITQFKEDNIFSTMNIVPHLYKNKYVYMNNDIFKKRQDKLVKKGVGNYYLFDKIRKEDIEKYYPKNVEEVLVDNKYILLLEAKN